MQAASALLEPNATASNAVANNTRTSFDIESPQERQYAVVRTPRRTQPYVPIERNVKGGEAVEASCHTASGGGKNAGGRTAATPSLLGGTRWCWRRARRSSTFNEFSNSSIG